MGTVTHWLHLVAQLGPRGATRLHSLSSPRGMNPMTDRSPSVAVTVSNNRTHMDWCQAELAHIVYVDNFVDSPPAQNQSNGTDFLRRTTSFCTKRQLTWNGSQLGCGITPRRFWRFFTPIEELLHRRKCCCWVTEVVVVHGTFCFLFKRPLLSIWYIVYKFIRSPCSQPVDICSEVQSEVRAFQGDALSLERFVVGSCLTRRLGDYDRPLASLRCCAGGKNPTRP